MKQFKPGSGPLDLEVVCDYVIERIGGGKETPDQYIATKTVFFIGAAAVFEHLIPFMATHGKAKTQIEIARIRQQLDEYKAWKQTTDQGKLILLPGANDIIH